MKCEEHEYNKTGYTVRRYFVDDFYSRHIASVRTGGFVLDLGGKKTGKFGLFDIARYGLKPVYLNKAGDSQPDIMADANNLPFRNQCFDAIVCAELLEHIFDPRAVLCEVHRCLHSGGVFLVSAPFLYRIHADPSDYGRYTDSFWREALEAAGFHDIQIERHGLFFSVLADFLRQYVYAVGIFKPFGSLARWGIARYQGWALKYERKKNIQEHPFLRSFTTGFGIVARK
jgi:SAM-dependent methyltransferase